MEREVGMPSRGYLLCSIPRTGSGLLAGALIATGVAGRPREYFNPSPQDKSMVRAVLDDSTVVTGFSKILIAGTTPNGVFGTKLHWDHLRHLGLAIRAERSDTQKPSVNLAKSLRSQSPELLPVAVTRELLRTWMPDLTDMTEAYAWFQSRLSDLRVVWMTRRNMVARAVSHFRARRTGVWNRLAKNANGVSPGPGYEFNATEIHDLYCLAGFQEECWQLFFQEHGIVPLRIVYEDLAAEYESNVQQVLRFLDLETPSIPPPQTLRQADEISKNWELRYRQLSAEAGLE
jgi:trehalose 2-sulfotransferase